MLIKTEGGCYISKVAHGCTNASVERNCKFNIFLTENVDKRFNNLLHYYINVIIIFKCIMEVDNILMSFQGLQYVYFALNILNSNGTNHLHHDNIYQDIKDIICEKDENLMPQPVRIS